MKQNSKKTEHLYAVGAKYYHNKPDNMLTIKDVMLLQRHPDQLKYVVSHVDEKNADPFAEQNGKFSFGASTQKYNIEQLRFYVLINSIEAWMIFIDQYFNEKPFLKMTDQIKATDDNIARAKNRLTVNHYNQRLLDTFYVTTDKKQAERWRQDLVDKQETYHQGLIENARVATTPLDLRIIDLQYELAHFAITDLVPNVVHSKDFKKRFQQTETNALKNK